MRAYLQQRRVVAQMRQNAPGPSSGPPELQAEQAKLAELSEGLNRGRQACHSIAAAAEAEPYRRGREGHLEEVRWRLMRPKSGCENDWPHPSTGFPRYVPMPHRDYSG